MTSRILGLFALAALGVAAACVPDPTSEQTAETSHAIVNGQPSPDDQDAVVFIVDQTQDESCSGTLVAPNLVLTARHCVSELSDDGACSGITKNSPASSLSIQMGADADGNNPDAQAKKIFYVAGDTDIDCGNDIALIQLDHDIPNAPTRAIRFKPPFTSQPVSTVGYGLDENNQPTDGRFERTGMTILAIGPASFDFTKQDGTSETVNVSAGTLLTSEGACHGDSGGPLFNSKGEIIGTVASGGLAEDVCVDSPDIYMGLTQHEDAIRQVFQTVGHPLPPADEEPSDAGPHHHDGGGHHDGGFHDGGFHHDGGHHHDGGGFGGGGDDDDDDNPLGSIGVQSSGGDDDDGTSPKSKDGNDGTSPSGLPKAASSGCAAAPTTSPSDGLAVALGLALALAFARRRRAS